MEKEDYYYGVCFTNFQSGNPDQPTPAVMKAFEDFVIALNKEKIRCYNNFQIGKPGHPCGIPGYPPCQ